MFFIINFSACVEEADPQNILKIYPQKQKFINNNKYKI